MLRRVDLSEFPHLPLTDPNTPPGHSRSYPVDPSVRVLGWKDGEMQWCPVSAYSVHPGCEEWEVKTERGRTLLVSADHSLAVLGPGGAIVPCHPSQATGRLLPVPRHLASPGPPASVSPEEGWRLGSEMAQVDPVKREVPGEWFRMAPETRLAVLLGLWNALGRPRHLQETDTHRQLLLGGLGHDGKARGGRLYVPWGRMSREGRGVRGVCGCLLTGGCVGGKGEMGVGGLATPLWAEEILRIDEDQTTGAPGQVRWEDAGECALSTCCPSPLGSTKCAVPRFHLLYPLAQNEGVGEKEDRKRGEQWKVLGRRCGRTDVVGRKKGAHPIHYSHVHAREDVGWDRVVSARPTGRRVEMYDLTVPGGWTFCLAQGPVVWDTMAAFVPITPEATAEVRRMMPSSNLFMEATGRVAYSPTLDSALGLYAATDRPTPGKPPVTATSTAHALDLLRQGKVALNDPLHLGGKPTTPGRILLASHLPAPMQHGVLHGTEPLGKGQLEKLLTTLGQNHKEQYGTVVNAIKDVGNDVATGLIRPHLTGGQWISVGGHSLGLDDIAPDKATRSKMIEHAESLLKTRLKPGLTEPQRERIITETWAEADAAAKKHHQGDGSLFKMHQAGKPSWTQYKQMRLAPVLYTDSNNKVIPTPVLRSLAEGFTLSDYWTSTYGARRGAVMKVQEVSEPGYLTKLLQNTAMDVKIDGHDCGAKTGLHLPASSPELAGRTLLEPYKHGPLHLPAGTQLTPHQLQAIRTATPDHKLHVRSPLHCEHHLGVCQQCAGAGPDGAPQPVGTFLGVQAAHTLGERAVQLTLKEFHSGGVAGGSSKTVGAFDRFQHLTFLPEKIPMQATLAMHTGTVQAVTPTATGAEVTINGHKHFVPKDSSGFGLHEHRPGGLPQTAGWTPPAPGQHVKAGDMLSDPGRSFVNPHDLYAATKDMGRVQNHLVGAIHDLYKDEGVKRVHVETLVRAMGNAAKVIDPGDHPHALPGEVLPLPKIKKWNETLKSEGKKLIQHAPTLSGVDMLPLEMREDWMAKLQHQRLHESLASAAAMGHRSSIHSAHPIAGMAYGAEFGLHEGHSKQLGREHLKNVPKHHT